MSIQIFKSKSQFPLCNPRVNIGFQIFRKTQLERRRTHPFGFLSGDFDGSIGGDFHGCKQGFLEGSRVFDLSEIFVHFGTVANVLVILTQPMIGHGGNGDIPDTSDIFGMGVPVERSNHFSLRMKSVMLL